MMSRIAERGSISLYLLIILSVLVSFMILMFDLVQDRWTKAETENYVRQLGRSAMSQFEPELLSYGLFGTALVEDKMNSIDEILSSSQKSQIRKNDYSLIGRTWIPHSFSYEGLYHLGDHRVLYRQILERMKVMAPLEYADELIDTLSAGKAEIEQVSRYLELGEQLEELINQRENQLIEAWQIAEKFVHDVMNQAIMMPVQQVISPFNEHLQQAAQLNRDIQLLAPELPVGMAEIIIYPSSYFTKYQLDISIMGSMYEVLQQLTEETSHTQMQQQEDLKQMSQDWLTRHSYYEQQRKAKISELLAQQDRAKVMIRQEMEQRGSQMEVICSTDREAIYNSLVRSGGIFDKYKQLNHHQPKGGIIQTIRYDSPESLITATHNLLNQMAELFTTLRDEIYVNEYILTYFSNLTSQPTKYLLTNQEAEYILYGLPSCRLNLSAAETELFLFRAALHTMDTLIKPNIAAASASPMGVFLIALAEGVSKANIDMEQLFKGEKVELPVFSKVMMNYKDHLRLFLLLHSSQAATLSRVQSLIELNTGIPLAERYTAIRVKSFFNDISINEVVVSY